MADTRRTLSAILALFADNTSGDISPQDARDYLVSTMNDLAVKTVTENTVLTTDDYLVLADASSGQITVTLPGATTCPNKRFKVKRISASNNVIVASAGGTIDGAASLTISAQWIMRSVVSDGVNWLCDVREDW